MWHTKKATTPEQSFGVLPLFLSIALTLGAPWVPTWLVRWEGIAVPEVGGSPTSCTCECLSLVSATLGPASPCTT